MDNALSATSMLRKRYVSTSFDIFGLGSHLAKTRFGSFVQRVSAAYAKYAPKGTVTGAIKKWDFEAFKMANRPVSDYCEKKDEIALDLIPWVQIKAVCFTWAVDDRGNLQVSKIYGYVSLYFKIEINLFLSFCLPRGNLKSTISMKFVWAPPSNCSARLRICIPSAIIRGHVAKTSSPSRRALS